ncbi:MAG TPA: dihydroorotase [Actinomycetota bacterium]|nr:dihydroorotase [Actinomycetota bacterium]
MVKVLLRGGRVVDGTGARDADVLVSDGVVEQVAPGISSPRGAEVLDCAGTVVCPGFVDLHVHFREPGSSADETVHTGSRAAALGGYTAVCPMPNTTPAADRASVVETVWRRGLEAGLVDVFPIGAITADRAGERLAAMGEMNSSAAQVRMFSDDGDPVPTAHLMRRAMEYALIFDAVIVDHAEDPSMRRGHMHEGSVSAALGVAGIPAEAEEICVRRDIALARMTGARLHIAHLTTAGAAEAVREAKREGLRVTCEVTPHHLALTDESLVSFDTSFKVAPPLRPDGHVQALKQACADGTVDAVATDHAPHAPYRKDVDFEHAPCGMLGLETALGVVLTELVEAGICGVERVVEMMSIAPAKILGREGHGGPVAEGAAANLVVFDPEHAWTVDPRALSSKSRNTPFAGRKLKGKVLHTMLRGRFTVRDGLLTEVAG